MRTSLSITALLFLPSAVVAQPARPVGDSLLVSVEWLRAHRSDRDLVLVHIGHAMDTTRQEMIPGSIGLDYMAALTRRVGQLGTEMPPIDSLRACLEALGISSTSRVVISSLDPVMAARAFVTLEVAGLDRLHVLDGGPLAWKNAGGAVVTTAARPTSRGRITTSARHDIVVDADWVRARLDDPRVALFDTRTEPEYTGTGDRRGIPSNGHLAGARLLIWETMLRSEQDPRFKPRDVLLSLYRDLGAAADKTVVTYCYIGYRASISYFVARYLGFDARFYDGSYNDWSIRNYPLVTGNRPR
jgi:thiosulfate/3-mercaptopyruvate sulfurtransferase